MAQSIDPQNKIIPASLITEHDIYLFKEGNHFKLYEKLGAHPGVVNGVAGTHFAVWAPNAKSVSVIGNFNHWDRNKHPIVPALGFFRDLGRLSSLKCPKGSYINFILFPIIIIISRKTGPFRDFQ